MKELITPNGYNEMIEVFGDIKSHLNEDGTLQSSHWENLILDFCYLPFSMILSWNKQIITRFRCHWVLVDRFRNLFTRILIEGLENECKYFGGCYSFRAKRGSKKISTHAWGIAIDINPDTNQMGTKGDMNPKIIEIFESFGFVWGGNFSVPDPMHFQFVKNY